MVKAVVKLSNGAEVTIEGNPGEVQELLNYYGESSGWTDSDSKKKIKTAKKKSSQSVNSDEASAEAVGINDIVNLVKNCELAEEIETQILDRASQVDRVLLPLFIVHEYCDNNFGLSSGDISKITRELGVPVSQPNASRTLTGTGSKYVMADGVRKKGTKLTFKLSRRGVAYMKEVVDGKSSEK